MTKVSVIVPIYNSATVLENSINSILAQNIESMEIIAIDDCSTDNSAKVLKRVAKKDKRIRSIVLSKNIGQELVVTKLHF